MPKIKRVVTETAVVERTPPEEQQETHEVAEEDLWDYLDNITAQDWPKRLFYIYQIEPPVTKREGEASYLTILTEPFSPETLAQKAPQGIRFRILEKILGTKHRKVWFISQVPRPLSPVGPVTIMQPGSNQDHAELFKQAANALNQSPQLLETAARHGLEIVGNAYKTALETAGKPVDIAEAIIKLQQAGVLVRPEPFNWDRAFETFMKALPILKENGILGAAKPPEKARLGELTEMIEFLRELGIDGVPKPSSLETLIPHLAHAAENVTANLTRMFAAKQPVMQIPNGVTANPEIVNAAPAVQVPPPPLPAPAAGVNLESWLKKKIVQLWRDQYDAEDVANWLGMTMPEAANEIENSPKEIALAFFKAQPEFVSLVADASGVTFLESVIDELKKNSKPTAAV